MATLFQMVDIDAVYTAYVFFHCKSCRNRKEVFYFFYLRTGIWRTILNQEAKNIIPENDIFCHFCHQLLLKKEDLMTISSLWTLVPKDDVKMYDSDYFATFSIQIKPLIREYLLSQQYKEISDITRIIG